MFYNFNLDYRYTPSLSVRHVPIIITVLHVYKYNVMDIILFGLERVENSRKNRI